MNYPKFAVNEPVLICSEDYPSIQGIEAVVVAREWWEDSVQRGGSGFRYNVDLNPSPKNWWWMEVALRKRPSDFTFNELMDSLKTPVPV